MIEPYVRHWWFVKQYLRNSGWTSTSCISYCWNASVWEIMIHSFSDIQNITNAYIAFIYKYASPHACDTHIYIYTCLYIKQHKNKMISALGWLDQVVLNDGCGARFSVRSRHLAVRTLAVTEHGWASQSVRSPQKLRVGVGKGFFGPGKGGKRWRYRSFTYCKYIYIIYIYI